jgi:hypothetical protein
LSVNVGAIKEYVTAVLLQNAVNAFVSIVADIYPLVFQSFEQSSIDILDIYVRAVPAFGAFLTVLAPVTVAYVKAVIV